MSLPVVNNKVSYPPLKTTSYSALTLNKTCGYYFFLSKIKKLALFEQSIWTHFGTLVHTYIQAVLISEPQMVPSSKPWRYIKFEPLEPEVAAKKFIRTWFKFCEMYGEPLKEQYDGKNPKDLYKNATRAIMGIRSSLQKEFGDHKVLRVEEKIKAKTDFPQLFSGLIDIVIELADGTIVIVDLKTTSSHYMFEKFQNKYKDYQLTLYKHFFCEKNNIPPSKVKTCFLLMEKNGKKDPLKVLMVGSTKKKVENALKWMNGVLTAVQRDQYVKNRMSCQNIFGKPCIFKNTEHCI